MSQDKGLTESEREEVKLESARTFIGLGSNIEPRLEYLRSAVTALKNFGDVIRMSPIYETEPVGGIPQPRYLNAVIEFKTTLGPFELANHLKAIESALGRKNRPRWHEREIDLDLLFYADLNLESPDLTVPHSELHRRAFVLAPMADMAPDFEHPVLHRKIEDLFKSVGANGIKKTDLEL